MGYPMRRTVMPRWLPFFSVLFALSTSLFSSTSARADDKEDKIQEAIKQLKTNDDFRVRAQAAAALGVSKSDLAVKPLCEALDDKHEAVRGPVASALGKLKKPEGIPCLEGRLPSETDDKVKSLIEKNLKALRAIADGPEIPANAKWYVAVGKTNNKSSRSNDAADSLIRDILQKKLRSLSGYGLAPRNEKPDDAKKIMESKKLKGFELQVTLEPFAYEGDTLAIKMRFLIASYPDKSIKAASSPKISQSGVKKDDTATENDLIRQLLEDSVDKFDKNVASM